MKKTNLLLVLLLIINAVILWKVWCCSSCNHTAECKHKTECTADSGKCEHSDDKCSKGKDCCKHGDKSECKHGKDCVHGEKCMHKCDSTCKANMSMATMMLKMPEEHMVETKAWMKDSLGLSDEQITEITAEVNGILTAWETSNTQMKTDISAADEKIKGMLNEGQMKMVEAMMMKHCTHMHGKDCKKKCCSGKGEGHHHDGHEHEY